MKQHLRGAALACSCVLQGRSIVFIVTRYYVGRKTQTPIFTGIYFRSTISSPSPQSQSIDTPNAFASIRSSASQTCLWFFSIREIIRGVISIPISCILRARSSCVIGGFCKARPSRTRSEQRFPLIKNKVFAIITTPRSYIFSIVNIQLIDFNQKYGIILTRGDR